MQEKVFIDNLNVKSKKKIVLKFLLVMTNNYELNDKWLEKYKPKTIPGAFFCWRLIYVRTNI